MTYNLAAVVVHGVCDTGHLVREQAAGYDSVTDTFLWGSNAEFCKVCDANVTLFNLVVEGKVTSLVA